VVDIGAVVDTHDVDCVCPIVYPVHHPVRTSPGGVVAGKFVGKRPAYTV
jgi:hypothetical protein